MLSPEAVDEIVADVLKDRAEESDSARDERREREASEAAAAIAREIASPGY